MSSSPAFALGSKEFVEGKAFLQILYPKLDLGSRKKAEGKAFLQILYPKLDLGSNEKEKYKWESLTTLESPLI